MARFVSAITLALTIAIIILVGIQVTDTVVQSSDSIEADESRVSTAALLNGTTFVSIDNAEGTNETVFDSRGYAINLTGASDSSFESDSAVDYGSGNFTASLWASVTAGSAGETMAAASLDGHAVIAYNGSGADKWVGWYYNESTTNSYNVKLDATGDLSDLHNLVLRANGTHLSLYRNNTDANHTAFVSSNIQPQPNTTQNWDGRIEELRTFDDALNASQRSDLFADGVGALPSSNRTARAMFDQPNKSTQLLFFSDASLTTSNVSYSQGLVGSEMVPGSNVSAQSDYVWETDGPRIRAVSGGELEFAPVAYVDYDKKEGDSDAVEGVADAYDLAPIIVLALVASALVLGVRSFA